MLGEERQQAILAAVEQRHSVSVQELMQLLDISESTIRRDLNALDKEGRLVKVHGGAMAIGGSFHVKDDAVEYRKEINREEKIEIARYAAALIKDQDVVYMDAGTTTELMIDYITAKNVIFVTNSLHMQSICHRKAIRHISLAVSSSRSQKRSLEKKQLSPWINITSRKASGVRTA